MLIVRGKHTGTLTAIGAALGTALGTALGNTPLGLAAGAGGGAFRGPDRQARGLGAAMPCQAGGAASVAQRALRARR